MHFELKSAKKCYEKALNYDIDDKLVDRVGKKILLTNRLPNAEFIISTEPDTFDEYYIKDQDFD